MKESLKIAQIKLWVVTEFQQSKMVFEKSGLMIFFFCFDREHVVRKWS